MEWFFDGWEGLARVALFAFLGYLAFVLIIRLTGKRTLSRMNAFDFILSIAIGSLLGRTILSKDVALSEGILALCVLVSMQALFTYLSIRHRVIRKLVQAEPELLVYKGTFLMDRMHHQRVVREDILEALRHHGVSSMDIVDAVILEDDGRFSVVLKRDVERKDAIDPLLHQYREDTKP